MISGLMIIFFLSFLILLCARSKANSLSWIGESKSGIFYPDDPLVFNCSLTDPLVTVSLWHKPEGDGGVYQERVPDVHLKKNNQIFSIDAMVADDRGSYQCRAAKIKSYTILTVHFHRDGIRQPHPNITFDNNEVEYGDDITVKCSAIGQVYLKWYKKNADGTLVELDSTSHTSKGKDKRLTTQTLLIRKFSRRHDGLYRCLLSRPLVNWKAYAEINITLNEIKPYFKSFPGPHVTVKQGRDLDHDFEYKVKGSPRPSISWYKVNSNSTEKLLAEYNGKKWRRQYDSSQFHIDKHGVSLYRATFPEDNMKLKCVAKNVAGSASKTFSISVQAPPKIFKRRDLDIVDMIRGSPEVKVVCRVEKANPRNLTYSWEIQPYTCRALNCNADENSWKRVDPMMKMKYLIVSSHENSTLTIRQNKQRIFVRCTAFNDIGKDNHTWRVIIVTDPTPLNSLKKSIRTDERKNISLSCTADEFVFRKVIWRRNNMDIHGNSSRFIATESVINNTVYYTLRIRRVNLTDGGTYKCIGFYNDQPSITKEISLTVQELKTPSAMLRNFVGRQSSSFKIPCNVTGYPKPTISWSKDGQPLSALPSLASKKACSNALSKIYKLSSEEDNHMTVLIICKANYKIHSGLFKCMASNKLGDNSSEAFINITAPPVIDNMAKSYETELGEQFALNCVSSGNPRPRVWWEKKGKDREEFKRLENTPSHRLVFRKVVKDNLGVYRCVAENKIDRSTKDIQLVLQSLGKTALKASEKNSKKFVVVIGCVSFAVLAIVIIVAVVLYKRKKIYGGFYILTLPPLPDYIKKLDPGTPLTEQTNKLPYDPEWEFPRNRLKFSRELGSGAFGKVMLAEGAGIVALDPRGNKKRRSSKRRFGSSFSGRQNHYVNQTQKITKVAVKTLKDDSGQAEYKDLLSELKILIHVGEHKNIVNLLGACTKGRESDLWVIIEFCSNGNLLQFLRNRRDIYESVWMGVSKDPNKQLTMTDLVIAAYQIARGMEFLASRMCIHRDLALRNILVAENYVIKIADFGLARDVGQDSQYIKTSAGLLPIKWMAIEAIIERLFTEKSDVWSFAVVLWELFTLGGTPYPSIPPNEVPEFLAQGNRMDPPHACPEEIASMMIKCWHVDRDERPSFKKLVEMLDNVIEVHTSSEGGSGYLEVHGDDVMSADNYLRPSEVKSPQMDPFQCNSPLPPTPSTNVNERYSLLGHERNGRDHRFDFDKSVQNKAPGQSSEQETNQKDSKPGMRKADLQRPASNTDGYINTSLTGNEKDGSELRDLDDRDSSVEVRLLDDRACWEKSYA